MESSIAVYYGNYYCYNNRVYAWPPEVFFIKGLLNRFEKVVLLAPIKYITNEEDLSPMFIEIEKNNCLFIKELPFYNSRLSALLALPKLKGILRNLDVKYAFIAQVMLNAMEIASILNKKKIEIRVYVGSNPLEILNSKELSNSYIYNLLGKLYVKYLLIQTNKYKCLINGQSLYEKIDVKNKSIINSSTLFRSDRILFNESNSELKLLFVGRLVSSKKVDILIRAVREVKKKYPEVILNLVGEGPLMSSLIKISNNLGVSDNVVFLGGVSLKSELYELYKNSFLFVFSSLSEGNPRVIKEATFFNLPSVSTRVGNLENEYTNGKDISFFQFDDYKELAYKICDLYQNVNKYKNIKDNLKKHDVVTIEDFVGNIYNEFVSVK